MPNCYIGITNLNNIMQNYAEIPKKCCLEILPSEFQYLYSHGSCTTKCLLNSYSTRSIYLACTFGYTIVKLFCKSIGLVAIVENQCQI